MLIARETLIKFIKVGKTSLDWIWHVYPSIELFSRTLDRQVLFWDIKNIFTGFKLFQIKLPFVID